MEIGSRTWPAKLMEKLRPTSLSFQARSKTAFFTDEPGEEGGPGYLVIEGMIAADGSAKLTAKGTVTQNHAHGVFATKGNNYGYNIKAKFEDTKGTGTRDEGAGLLGRPCTFEFVKQPDASPSTNPPPTTEH